MFPRRWRRSVRSLALRRIGLLAAVAYVVYTLVSAREERLARCSPEETASQLRLAASGAASLEEIAASRAPCAPIRPSVIPAAASGAGKPLVVDVFPFNGEVDMLEVRLRELAPVVDVFIITECDFDDHGNAKRRVFHSAAVRARWSFAGHKIRYASCGEALRSRAESEFPAVSWAFNHAIYHAGTALLRHMNLSDDALVISGDLDELVRAAAVREAAADTSVRRWLVGSQMMVFDEFHCFASDWPTRFGRGDFRFPVLARASEMRGKDAVLSMRSLAYERPETFGVLSRSGAHLTWRADPLMLALKLRSQVDPPQTGGLRVLGANVTSADVVDLLADLRENGGRKTFPSLAARAVLCKDAWLPAFFRENRARFRF